ncbi:ABC-three component system middle component 6 [Aeromonas veronii]|uniref:ABC-three component system middle component 6 n=1 Tax=Aeromonas veronii TaxID=654 RepID=UPI003B9DD2D1
MLLPEYTSPEDSLYYNGAIILNCLREYKKVSFTDLYLKSNETKKISISIYLLSLDWLYLLNLVDFDSNGDLVYVH